MVDIFDVLKNIDSTNIDYYKNLSAESKKQIYFFLIQRWMTGINDTKQILFVNHFVNNKIWSLYKDQDLVYKLLCASSTGKKRYSWIPKKKKETKSETLKLICEYYSCCIREGKEYLSMLQLSDILDIAEMYAIDKETIAKIKKEYK